MRDRKMREGNRGREGKRKRGMDRRVGEICIEVVRQIEITRNREEKERDG